MARGLQGLDAMGRDEGALVAEANGLAHDTDPSSRDRKRPGTPSTRCGTPRAPASPPGRRVGRIGPQDSRPASAMRAARLSISLETNAFATSSRHRAQSRSRPPRSQRVREPRPASGRSRHPGRARALDDGRAPYQEEDRGRRGLEVAEFPVLGHGHRGGEAIMRGGAFDFIQRLGGPRSPSARSRSPSCTSSA